MHTEIWWSNVLEGRILVKQIRKWKNIFSADVRKLGKMGGETDVTDTGLLNR
jgi:hypothetical protein